MISICEPTREVVLKVSGTSVRVGFEYPAKLQQTNATAASTTGPDAARQDGFAPRPVAAPSLKGQSKEQETPVLSS